MPVKLGIVGTGYFGRKHLESLSRIPDFEIVGFIDSDELTAVRTARDFKIARFLSAEALINSVDALDIVTPSNSHFLYAASAIKQFKHVFIEKPMVVKLSEAKQIMELSKEAGVFVQVGHIERYNPAFLAAKPHIRQPLFIETTRLSTFQNRGNDISVIFDLLIHDIDLVLSIAKANVRKIHANGAAVINNSIDLANVRIEFDNGCVANLTASRVAMQKVRKVRVFQKKSIVKIDLLERKTEVISLNTDLLDDFGHVRTQTRYGLKPEENMLIAENLPIEPVNAIEEELTCFAKSILSGTPPVVSLHDGYQAVEIANRISEKIRLNH